MSFFYKVFFNVFFIFSIFHFPLYGMVEEEKEVLEGGRIRVKTIIAYDQILDYIEQEKERDPTQNFHVLTDWDDTVTGIKNFDHKDFHRQGNTAFVIQTVKDMNIPVVVMTARWHHHYSEEDFKKWAQAMEQCSSISLSDQESSKGKEINLRKDFLKRGMYIQGICFTGSMKADVASAYIDRVLDAKTSHFIYVEDDPKYKEQMINVFKTRKNDKLTVLYYPHKVQKKKHALMLEQLSSASLSRKLPFFIRHDYANEVKKLFEDPDSLAEIKNGNSLPYLVDLMHSEGEELVDYMFEKIEFNLAHLKIEEIGVLLRQCDKYKKPVLKDRIQKKTSQ